MPRIRPWLLLSLVLLSPLSRAADDATLIRHQLLDVERNLLLYGCTGSEYFRGHLNNHHGALRQYLGEHANAAPLLDILALYDEQIAQIQHTFSRKGVDSATALQHALQVRSLFDIYLPPAEHDSPASLADNLRALALLRIRQACIAGPAPTTREPEVTQALERQIRQQAASDKRSRWAADWRYLQLSMPGDETLLHSFGSQVERLIEKADRQSQASPARGVEPVQ